MLYHLMQFQSRHDVNSLEFVKKSFNKRERIAILIFIFFLIIMFSLVFLYYNFVKENNSNGSYYVYSSIYIFDFICILISSIKLTRIIYKKRNEAYEEHKLIIAVYALLICCSIITRLAFSYGLL